MQIIIFSMQMMCFFTEVLIDFEGILLICEAGRRVCAGFVRGLGKVRL